MRKKAVLKPKEQVRLRVKKLSNGNQSLYLDCYKDGHRTYEFLKLYLIPETDTASKERNKETLKAAKAIQSRRTIEVIDSVGGLSKQRNQSKMMLVDLLNEYSSAKNDRGRSDSNARHIRCLARHIIAYKGEKTTLAQIDREYCLGFIDYLKTATAMPRGKKADEKAKHITRALSQSTQALYLIYFSGAINYAAKKKYISKNPFDEIDKEDKITTPPSNRDFLTAEELKKFMAVSDNETKRAFIFSCFTGLRLSDVRALTWGQIFKDGDERTRASVIMQKTAKPISLTLPDEALKALPEKGEANDRDKVFHLPVTSRIEAILKKIATTAGINKHVTFHVSRHTFATLQLSFGTDIYTVSKLLGHRSLETTQIYATIIDKMKDDAADRMNGKF
jgi:integrase